MYPSQSVSLVLLFMVGFGSIKAQGVTTIDEDGFILRNNERFFPYGFYLEERDDFDDLQKNVKTIGEAGFNVALVEPRDNDKIGNVFDEAERQSLMLLYAPDKYIVEYFGLDSLLKLLDDLDIKDEPNLLGYNIADDVRDGDMTGQPLNVQDVKRFHDAFKKADPNHLTFVAIGGGDVSTIWNDRNWDVGGYESYPSNGGSPLNLVYEGIELSVSKAEKLGQSPVALLQSFNWGEGDAQRPPTPEEFRNMLYQALVAGAKGVAYYTYDKENLGIEQYPKLWKAAQASVAEIEVLRPFLLNSTRRFESLGDNLWVASWEYQDELVATVVYTGNYKSYFDPQQNDFDTRNFSWTLPEGYANSSAENLFTAYPSDITNQSGKATGSIRLLEVQVVKFSREENSSKGTGLTYALYNNKALSGSPVSTGTDTTVNFDWKSAGKANGLTDNFSIRWSGQVQPIHSEEYTFYTRSDDGVRLWVDGELLVDNWTNHAETEDQGKITLQAGQKYDIQLEYFENKGKAVCKLLWESGSQSQQVIPQTALYANQKANARVASRRKASLLPEADMAVRVYPNPVSTDRLTVSLPATVDRGTLSIISLSGQTLLQKSFSGSSLTLSRWSLSQGTYVMRIVTDQSTHTQKIVIP